MSTTTATVFALFADAAARHPHGAFMCILPETAAAYGIEAGEISYEAALAATLKLSEAYAKAGYGSGQRVGLLLENRPAFFRHWFALNRLGVSVVPINPDLRAAELEYVIDHSEMIAAVVVPERRGDLENAARANGHPLALHGPDDEPQPLAVRSTAGEGRPIPNAPCSIRPAPPVGPKAACWRTNISSPRASGTQRRAA